MRNARRLNGPICGIGSAGSIVGTILVGTLATTDGNGRPAALGCGDHAAARWCCAYLAYRHGGEPQPKAGGAAQRHAGGATCCARSRVLAILLVIILLTQAISGLTDLSFQGILQDQMPEADAQTAFSGWFYMWLNIAGRA